MCPQLYKADRAAGAGASRRRWRGTVGSADTLRSKKEKVNGKIKGNIEHKLGVQKCQMIISGDAA